MMYLTYHKQAVTCCSTKNVIVKMIILSKPAPIFKASTNYFKILFLALNTLMSLANFDILTSL